MPMPLIWLVVLTIVGLGIPASVLAHWLVALGRKVAGTAGMKVAAVVAVLIAAVPLFWAAKHYWLLWMAGISLRPQYGDHYLGLALTAAFICLPMVVVISLRRFWRGQLPTTQKK
jgi:hypothetical protein